MKSRYSRRIVVTVAVATMLLILLALLNPLSSAALPQYATATGQPCATCHTNPAGGGPLTAVGQAFAGVANHATNPAAAFAQVTAPAPAPGATAAPAPAAPAGSVSVLISGAAMDDSVTYSIVVRNGTTAQVANLYIAGSVPAGTTVQSTGDVPTEAGFATGGPSPVGAAMFASDTASVSWLLDALPARGVVGPFTYTVTRGASADLTANAFVHWLTPSEGRAFSGNVTPITNSQRLAVDQEVANRMNNLDRSLTLWNMLPGLGTVMIEYSIRFDNLWFAAQAGNWQMTRYQVAEMTEIQEVGETTRPNRAPALKAFEQSFLDPLDDAAAAKDLNAFVAAYDKAIGGCNSCHASSTGVPPDRSVPAKFIKIVRPSAPVFSNVDWKGQ